MLAVGVEYGYDGVYYQQMQMLGAYALGFCGCGGAAKVCAVAPIASEGCLQQSLKLVEGVALGNSREGDVAFVEHCRQTCDAQMGGAAAAPYFVIDLLQVELCLEEFILLFKFCVVGKSEVL